MSVNISQLQQKRMALMADLDAILQRSAEADGSMSEEETALYDSTEKKIKDIDNLIERSSKIQSERAKLEGPSSKPVEINVIRNERHNEKGEYRGFSSKGDFLRSVSKSFRDPMSTDSRLKELRASLGMNTDVGAEGGFAVQTDHAQAFLEQAYEQAQLASKCTSVEVSSASNSMEMTLLDETSRATGSRYGGVRGYWRAQGNSVTATKPALRNETFNLNALEVLAYATDEQLEDSAVLDTFIVPAAESELAWLVDDAILHGTGVGQPLGIMNSGAIIEVAKKSGQVAATIVYENVRKMKNRLLPKSRTNFEWYVHPDAHDQLEVMMLSGSLSDIPVFLPAGGLSGREYETLYGRKINTIEQAKAVGTPGDILALDLSKYILLKKKGIRAAQSMHVEFLTSQHAFKWTVRIDGKPMVRSPLTDANGSTTRSPFIAVAVRS